MPLDAALHGHALLAAVFVGWVVGVVAGVGNDSTRYEPMDRHFGTVHPRLSGCNEHQREVSMAVAMLHSFWYDEARATFQSVLSSPTGEECLMAHWGLAYSFWRPLWSSTTEEECAVAEQAIRRARAVADAAGPDAYHRCERGMIEAAASLFLDFKERTARDRTIAHEQALQALHEQCPADTEIACMYSLALNAKGIALLGDTVPHSPSLVFGDAAEWRAIVAVAEESEDVYRGIREQWMSLHLRASLVARGVLLEHQYHPGALHYEIHSNDFPELAHRAKDAAHRYAKAAVLVPHALHMPAHIFIRVGEWTDAIRSDARSMAVSVGLISEEYGRDHGGASLVLHDEFIHSLDYLIYALLQSARDDAAACFLGSLFKAERIRLTDAGRGSCYSVLAAPSRLLIEGRGWRLLLDIQFPMREALPWHSTEGPWPWSELMLHYVRNIGSFYHMQSHILPRVLANADKYSAAEPPSGVGALQTLRDSFDAFEDAFRRAHESGMLESASSTLWLVTAQVQRLICTANVLWVDGEHDHSITVMRAAAHLEDKYQKPSVKPCVLYPAREQYAVRLLLAAELDGARATELRRMAQSELEIVLQAHPGRLQAKLALCEVLRMRARAGDGDVYGIAREAEVLFSTIESSFHEKLVPNSSEVVAMVQPSVAGSLEDFASDVGTSKPDTCLAQQGSIRARWIAQRIMEHKEWFASVMVRHHKGNSVVIIGVTTLVLLILVFITIGYLIARVELLVKKKV